MPSAAPRPCSYPGCRFLVRDGSARCPTHVNVERRASDKQRGTAHERGYTSKWQKAREGYLRLHPLCVRCADGERDEAAVIVDHKVPHRGDKALFWDRDNWQALCKPCHDIKTATEDGGFGRPAPHPGTPPRPPGG